MEASLFTVTPAPPVTQLAPSPAAQTTDETSPFTELLSDAITATDKDSQQTIPLAPDDSTANNLDMLMVADQTTLTSSQLVPDAHAFNSELLPDVPVLTSEFLPVAPVLNSEFLPVALALNSELLPVAPVLNNSQLVSDNIIAPNLTSIKDTSATILVTPAELKQTHIIPGLNNKTGLNPVPEASDQQAANPLNKNETLLAKQLQAILNGDSQATLVLRTPYQSVPAEQLNSLSSPYIQSAEGSAVIASILPAHVVLPEGAIDKVKTVDTGEGVRQNIEEQYLNAKLDGLADKNNAKNQNDNGKQEDKASPQNTANAILTAAPGNNEQPGPSFISALATQGPTPMLGVTAGTNTASLPPGASIVAEEVINNLIERFSINPRLQTSKISLNLNPAELGALKIDILVKGDSIKAHIAVNSHQIQDTIEKNMPRLRAILEQQGFNIEDFQVSLESTTSDSNHFFQQQFSSREDAAPRTPLASDDTSFDLSLSSAEENLSASMDSGINLNI